LFETSHSPGCLSTGRREREGGRGRDQRGEQERDRDRDLRGIRTCHQEILRGLEIIIGLEIGCCSTGGDGACDGCGGG
jgi:hypothetical protein